MAGNNNIPKAVPLVLNKRDILRGLARIDADKAAASRVLTMENKFRAMVKNFISSSASSGAPLEKFSTSPFVLMFHCMKRGYSKISEIEKDILPAKEFSSMETSAGRMVEEITIPAFGWGPAPSTMHSAWSSIDGLHLVGDLLQVVTLKSGPRCLNDEMSENFADSILNHCESWSSQYAGVSRIDFTYGVLYGTKKISNKKDWHILRNVAEKCKKHSFLVTKGHVNSWTCGFSTPSGLEVDVSVRIGIDWWSYIGRSPDSYLELCISLIRACVSPGGSDGPGIKYQISDLREIVSADMVPSSFNVSILQREQIPWLFFCARHFCDQMV